MASRNLKGLFYFGLFLVLTDLHHEEVGWLCLREAKDESLGIIPNLVQYMLCSKPPNLAFDAKIHKFRVVWCCMPSYVGMTYIASTLLSCINNININNHKS